LTGGAEGSGTTVVCAEFAEELPSLLVPVTTTLKDDPMSLDVTS
jgi:hypothetical protein